MNDAIYTKGPIGGTMVKTAFSMIAGTLAMSGYHIADTYFVGQLPGATALAAMGYSFPVVMLLVCIFRGLSIGVLTNVSQALGGGKIEKAKRLVTAGVLLVTFIAVMLGGLGILTNRIVFPLFGATGETLIQVEDYMSIWYLGCATAVLTMTGNDLLMSVGAPKMASLMMLLGMVFNVFLDPVMIFGYGVIPAMGVRGAAIATVISQGICALFVFAFIYIRYHLIKFYWIPWDQLGRNWSVMIKVAIPASIGMLMMPIGSVVVTRITSEFGDEAVAAASAAMRLEMVAFIFPMALGISLLPMIAQNFGARLYDRIRDCRRFSMCFAFYFLISMAVFYFFFSELLVGHFSTDLKVQQIMSTCLKITPWGFAMIEVHRYAGFFFIGCGRPKVAAWLNGIRILGLMIPFSFLAILFDSLVLLFWARLAADLIAGGIAIYWAKKMVNALPKDGEHHLATS